MLALALVFTLGGSCENVPPSRPIVAGPTLGRPGDSLQFAARSVDAEEDSISYMFDWGDGSQSSWSEPRGSGIEYALPHVFADSGFLGVRARARSAGQESDWSDSFFVRIRDFGPLPPTRPENNGPDTVPAGDTVWFVTKAGHPLGERVAFQFDWGDTLGEWSGFEDPDEWVSQSHPYGSAGVFAVRARAKDTLEHVGAWSKPETLWVVDSFFAAAERARFR